MVTTILFVVSLIVRLVAANQSFWLDEGSSIQLARLPLTHLFTSIGNDFHPPLFYLLLHYWLPLAGKSEWLIRLPNLILGAATVPLLYLFVRRLLPKEKKIAFLAALLLALNPLHIYYSAELRMYILNGFLSLFSWYFLLGGLKSKGNRDWYYFTAASVLNLYSFYGAVFNLLAQWLFVLWQHKKKIKPFAIRNLLIALLFLPWLPTFLKQLEGGGYLTQALPGWADLSGSLSPKALGLIIAKFTFGRISLANKNAYALFVISISLYFLLCSVLAWLKKENRLFLFWFYGALAAAVGVSFFTPVLGYWRFIFLLPAFVSVIILGLRGLPDGAFYFNLVVVALVFLFGLFSFWNTPAFQREDWRGAAKLISTEDSLTILNFPDTFAPLKFYAPSVYYYPAQERLGKVRSDLDKTLPSVLKDKEVVYVLDYLSDLTDKKRSILLWLKRAGFVQSKVHDINGVGFIYEFRAP